MREDCPWGARKLGEAAWAHHVKTYSQSPEWWRRRVEWLQAERELTAPHGIACIGGCGSEWRPHTDDLHHTEYTEPGEEQHEDLWPMCRRCHEELHFILKKDLRLRFLDFRTANDLALEQIISAQHSAFMRASA